MFDCTDFDFQLTGNKKKDFPIYNDVEVNPQPDLGFSIFGENDAPCIGPGESLEPLSVLQDVAERRSARECAPQSARVVITTSGERPRVTEGHAIPIDKQPTAVYIEQSSQTASFRINSHTISLKCYFDQTSSDIEVVSLGTSPLQCCGLSDSTLGKRGIQAINPNGSFWLPIGPWRISYQSLWIDMQVLPRSYDLTIKQTKRKLDETPDTSGWLMMKAPKKRRRRENGPNSVQMLASPKKAEDQLKQGLEEQPCGSEDGQATYTHDVLSRRKPSRNFTLTIRQLHPNARAVKSCSGESRRNKRSPDSYSISISTSIPVLCKSAVVYECIHKKKGIVALRVPHLISRDSIPNVTEEWRALKDLLSRLRSPWIVTFLWEDARILGIFTKFARPRLLEDMDSSYHFRGGFDDGIVLCLGMTSALVYLHNTIRMRHGHISARTVLWDGDRPVLAFDKVDAGKNPWYDASHESIENQFSQKSDMYALGVLACYVWGLTRLPEVNDWPGVSDWSSSNDEHIVEWGRYIDAKVEALGEAPEAKILTALLQSLPEERPTALEALTKTTEIFPDRATQVLSVSVGCRHISWLVELLKRSANIYIDGVCAPERGDADEFRKAMVPVLCSAFVVNKRRARHKDAHVDGDMTESWMDEISSSVEVFLDRAYRCEYRSHSKTSRHRNSAGSVQSRLADDSLSSWNNSITESLQNLDEELYGDTSSLVAGGVGGALKRGEFAITCMTCSNTQM